MFCSKCGTQIAQGAAFCPNCGTPAGTQVSGAYVAPPVQPVAQPINNGGYASNYGSYAPPTAGIAIAALVLTFFIPLVGLILGYAARKEINQSNGAKGGRGMATAAIALGWIFTFLGIIVAVIYIAYFASLASSYNY
jgi:hypothetical protein